MKKKVIFLDFDSVIETVFQLPLEEAMKVKYDKYGSVFDGNYSANARPISLSNGDLNYNLV